MFGNGNFATKDGSVLAYNDLNNNFKPLPFDFSRGSTATRVNKEGLIETVGTNEPRIDFKDDVKGALLLEPSRTNFMPYSNGFDNVAWDKGGSGIATAPIVTANQGISPDGSNNAFKLELNLNGGTTSSDRSRLTDNFTGVTSTNYTFSFYAKAYSSSDIGKVVKFAVDNSNGDALFTLTSKWKRFVFVGTSTGTNINQHIQLRGNESTSDSVTMLLYGYQVEQGSYATSYIPTSGGQVTRVADSCDNGANEQVINSTEGVLYVEMKNDIVQQQTISLFESNDNSVQLGLIHGNIRCAIGRSNQYVLGTVSPAFNYANGQINKYAIVWNGTSAKTFINGQLKNTITTPSPLNLKLLAMSNPLGSENMSGNIEDLRVYNTALTDQELQALTQV